MDIQTLFGVRDKVILVTGGSRGIGRMIAEGFAVNGARVYITARKAQECAQTVAELSQNGGFCKAIPADLSKPGEITRLVSELAKLEPNGLDVLVNNAGTNWAESIEQHSVDAFEKVIRLNLTAVFALSKECLPLLTKKASPQNPARIINIGSINGIKPPAFQTFGYSSSKAGLHMLTSHLGNSLAPNITVNAVAPGSFESKMMAETLANFGDVVRAGVPLNRIGKPSDMAAVCIWLASKGGSYVNGAVVVVDGGAVCFSGMAKM